jgi:hypothetical protein
MFSDILKPKGLVEVFVTLGKPELKVFDPYLSFDEVLSGISVPRRKIYKNHSIDFSKCTVLDSFQDHNIIVNVGKDSVINSLATGSLFPIARMAIGDRGTIPSDSTVPKVPTATMTALYNEVYRADVEATILDIGTPTNHKVKFIKTFSATDISITAFSNQSTPVINEVGLITIDETQGSLPRSPVEAPNAAPVDEKLFAIRTYKSIPFESSNDISVTIRYTIYIE